MDFDFLCWSMSQTFHTITLNMLVLTVDGIYSAHSQHTPLPQNAMLDIISQAQHSGPEQHQEKKQTYFNIACWGEGRRKTTTFVYMSEQKKFRPCCYKHGCLWIQNVCNPTDILSRKHVSGVRAPVQAYCQHQALVTWGVWLGLN